ncbi:MAG TPA: pseudouridine synthase [Kiritimatiellia bacterium]|nr:pseudouridine synthase [Kiritimatiellia bacterium]
MDTADGGVRLNKFISDTGICSRREADRLIEAGEVRVDGAVATLGTRVAPDAQVIVKGKPLRARPRTVYLAYHKPVGITSTTDRSVRGNIVDAVNHRARIFPVGRLDKDSEGLILLTNDGDIVNKILRAGNAHEKEYEVWVDRPFDDAFLNAMSRGVPILGTVTKPCKTWRLGARSFGIILTQGMNRQIRRMTEHLGWTVTRLRRIRIMHLHLGTLRPGQWRELRGKELETLNGLVADSVKTEEAS